VVIRRERGRKQLTDDLNETRGDEIFKMEKLDPTMGKTRF